MNTTCRFLLAACLLSLLASCATRETDRDCFIKADTNKDGRLSLDEVNKEGLPRLFDRFDGNGDGAVTLAETRQVDPGFEENVFAERDLNKDGKVTLAENEKVALSRGGLRKQFAEVDTNRDGIIEKTEAEAYIARTEAALN